jgi:hypothetical protein
VGGLEPARTQDAQRVVGEGLGRCAGCAQHPAGQVGHAAEEVDEDMPGYRHRHRVDGEVAPGQVDVELLTVGDRRVPRGRVVGFATVRGDLVTYPVSEQADRPEGDARLPGRLRPPTGDLEHPLRNGVRGEIEVGVGGTAEQGVPHRAADEVERMPVRGEDPAERVGSRRHREQLTHDPLRRVTRSIQFDHSHTFRIW